LKVIKHKLFSRYNDYSRIFGRGLSILPILICCYLYSHVFRDCKLIEIIIYVEYEVVE
jgi:hypothetical protein